MLLGLVAAEVTTFSGTVCTFEPFDNSFALFATGSTACGSFKLNLFLLCVLLVIVVDVYREREWIRWWMMQSVVRGRGNEADDEGVRVVSSEQN